MMGADRAGRRALGRQAQGGSRATVLLLLAAGFVFSAILAWSEWQVRRVEKLVQAGDYRRAVAAIDCTAACNPRVELSLGHAFARLAAGAGPDARPLFARRSLNHLTRATAAPATRARALAEIAFLRTMDASDESGAIAGLAGSYASAPFLRDLATWRVSFAASRWAEMSPALRDAAIAEAKLYSCIDLKSSREMDAAMGSSPLRVAYLLRRSDRDCRSGIQP